MIKGNILYKVLLHSKYKHNKKLKDLISKAIYIGTSSNKYVYNNFNKQEANKITKEFEIWLKKKSATKLDIIKNTFHTLKIKLNSDDPVDDEVLIFYYKGVKYLLHKRKKKYLLFPLDLYKHEPFKF